MRRPVIFILLAVILTSASVVRVPALATYGFSDDEAAKVRAIAAYRRGDFAANAEHPMLLKLTMWGTMSAADRWNTAVTDAWRVAPETALRLPNAIAGVLTVAAVYAVSAILFGPVVALSAAAIVSIDSNITAINRIGKEDTFLMLFFLIAVYCYERAKVVIDVDRARAQRWYLLCGAGFGLMLASKYMPHIYGLYALYNVSTTEERPNTGPNRVRLHAAMAAAFLAANVAIVLPSTWHYIAAYLHGGMLSHHGEMYENQLYVTNVAVSLAGVPFTYYFDLIGTKVSILVLACALAGIVPLIRRRHERGFVWLRVFLVFLTLGYSVMAAKFQRYSLPILFFIDILAAVGLVSTLTWLADRVQRAWAKRAVLTLGYVAVLGTLIVDIATTAPFYSMHQNAIGSHLEPPGTRFPEEAYDYGVREAVADIARVAPPGAAIVSDAPGVVEYYLARTGRRDIEARSLSRQGTAHRREQWVLVQDDHIYFENVSFIEHLRRALPPWREYTVMKTPVLQVFHLTS